MTQSHHIMRQAAFVGIFALMGCAPDLGSEVGSVEDVNRTATWPVLLTSAEIAALDATDLDTSETVAADALALNRRAAALRVRAAQLARQPVLSATDRRILQQAAASGQP